MPVKRTSCDTQLLVSSSPLHFLLDLLPLPVNIYLHSFGVVLGQASDLKKIVIFIFTGILILILQISEATAFAMLEE